MVRECTPGGEIFHSHAWSIEKLGDGAGPQEVGYCLHPQPTPGDNRVEHAKIGKC